MPTEEGDEMRAWVATFVVWTVGQALVVLWAWYCWVGLATALD